MHYVADKLRPLVPEHYRPAGHPPLLRVPGALPPQLQALSAERQLDINYHTSLHNIYIIYKILLHLSPLSSKQGLVDNNGDMPTITEETSIEHVNASLNCGGNNVSNLLTASPDTP